jgi:hypothetical protein
VTDERRPKLSKFAVVSGAFVEQEQQTSIRILSSTRTGGRHVLPEAT